MSQSIEQLQTAAEIMISTNKSYKVLVSQAKMPLVEEDKFQKDDETDKCSLCEFKFTLFKRRHHCRRCGFVMCGDCCPKKDNTRLCFVCNYAMTSATTALKSTLLDFLHSNPVKIFMAQKPECQQPLIMNQIYLVCGNLLNDDEIRQKFVENEELGMIMANAIDFMMLQAKNEQQQIQNNIKQLSDEQKIDAIQNVLGMLVNQSASNKKFFKPLGEIDYKFLIKYVSQKENQTLLQNMLWVLNNLSENSKFIQTLLKIKEIKTVIGKGIASNHPPIYEKAINLFIQIFKYQLGKIKSAEIKIQESATSGKDMKSSSDYSLDDNIVTSIAKDSITKIIATNLQAGQSPEIRLYSLLGISQFILVPKFAEQIMNVKKFDLFKTVAEIRKSVTQPRGQYIVYEFYKSIIELNDEQFNPYVIDKEVIKFVFNPELAKSGQRELLKLFFSQYSGELPQFLLDYPKIAKFFKKSYKAKDLQICLSSLNNEEVTQLFIDYGLKLVESKVEGDGSKSKVGSSRTVKKSAVSDSSDEEDSQNSESSDESS